VVGVGNVLIDISAFSAVPRVVPDRALAGVFGLLEALFQIGLALGAVTAGVLLHLFGARIALLVVGLLLPAAALIAAPLLHRFDVRLAHHDVEVDLLRRQPLFANLPIPVLDGLGARLTPAAFEAGEPIMSEGDQGDRYMLIVDGTVTFHPTRSRGKRPARRLSLRRDRARARHSPNGHSDGNHAGRGADPRPRGIPCRTGVRSTCPSRSRSGGRRAPRASTRP
jgi:hypothetical protein